jgi:hypothetical protein
VRAGHRASGREADRALLADRAVVVGHHVVGVAIDPDHAGDLHVDPGLWAERWFRTTADFKPASRRTYRKLLDNQILPTFERATLGAIDTLVVREWIAGLVEQGLSPSRVRNAHQVLSQVLAAGVEGGRIAATLRPGCGYRASSAGTCTS